MSVKRELRPWNRLQPTRELLVGRTVPGGRRVEARQEGNAPPPNRRIAVVAGVLFIVATAAVLVADAVEPAFAEMAEGRDQVAMTSFLRILAAGASVGIAICLYPLIRPVGGALAIGSVVFRTIEAVMYLAGVVALLSLVPLSRQLPSGGGTAQSTVQAMVDVLTRARHDAGLVAVFAFSVGAFMYYTLLYRARLVPRWLSAWGLLAVVLMFIACLLSLFGDSPLSDYKLLAAPIFLQEIVLGFWLMVRGLTSADRRPRPSANGPAEAEAAAGDA